MKIFGKIISAVTALSVAASCGIPAVFAAEDSDVSAASVAFDAETVMWTDRPIEEVLAETGKYETVRDVDPNAAKSTDSLNIQNPYGTQDSDYYQSWAYSEFVWTNYYPIGNGRMAGMVAGGIDNEVIQINEDTCWDGSPYGTLVDENGNTVTTQAAAYAAESISGTDMTSGSQEDGWKYYRGANEDGTPAEIGSADAVVGDEEFRSSYPDYANLSIAYQALNVDNSATLEAVQDRWSLESMVEAVFLGNPSGQRAYKSFVEVYLDFGHDSDAASNYVKSLDMETGVVTVEYDYGGSHYKRESFASYPDQTIVTHIESDAELSFSAELHTYHNTTCTYEKVSDNEVKVRAAVTDGNKDNTLGRINVINFEARMLLDGDGTFSVSSDNTTVTVSGGKEATVYVVGATNYVDYKTLDNSKPAEDCEYYMNNVKSRTYEQIKARHLADFTEQFAQTSLTLENSGDTDDYGDTPTEERVRKPVNGESGFLKGAGSKLTTANSNGIYSTYSEGDNQLATLEFNYGKYLLISGARDSQEASDGEIEIPISQPLNLTGKWNGAMSASWNGKYTININTEMNYWAAQPLGLADSEKTLIDTLADLAESGAITAANQYAIYNDRGDDTYQPGDPWVMHHNFDLWRGTQPIDNATAGLWPTGGAWLLDHAWQYYKYNKDTEYLAEVYPYMVGAAKFFTQFLVVDPQTGYLITAASCSPEQGGVQPGPAMDTQLVRNLYDMVREASEILGKEDENADLLAKIDEQMPSSYLADEQGKLAPNLIDSSGLIQEWVRGDVTFDISEKSTGQWTVTNPFTGEESVVYNHTASNNTTHRHCSHLWEMYPGTHLSGYSDDENEQKIFKAFQKSVSARGTGSGQGWGLAWRIALNARALDGDTASEMLEQLFTTRTSPNLFDQHPNFQIDGNYGATAGIIEMLIQSHDGAITLLPALPSTWTGGSFEGFETREGATVDLTWSEGKPTEAKIHATETKDMSIRTKYISEATITDSNGNAVEFTLNDDLNLATFSATAGETYTITNFGTSVVENDVTYAATDVTEFYASDNGSKPKADGDGYSIGYIYNRENVKIGYAVNDFDFDGLTALTLKMKSVRYSDTYAIITVDDPEGTEIANQIITTGNNELELKNLDGISGTHKIYVLYIQSPYDGDTSHKYLGNAEDLIATYSKSASSTDDTGEYEITSAAFDGDQIVADISYTGESDAPAAVLIAATYDTNGVLTQSAFFDIIGAGSGSYSYTKPESGTTKLFIWDSADTMKPLSEAVSAADSSPSASASAEPTAAASAEPTATASAEPTESADTSGVFIGDTEYESIRAAIASIEENPPTSEAERVTIELNPGVYREQVYVSAPYVTIKKKEGTSGEAKITWYYGLGAVYDSCNSSGYYDESAIGDGLSYAPTDWGPALKVAKTATAFIAEDLYLENSFNSYYTEEELEDMTGVDPSNTSFYRLDWLKEQIANGVDDDTINSYLQSRKDITYNGTTASPRERCAALHCSADMAQFINCTIMSTQDTIGINTGRMYFKNCKLGGTTDYICGSATAVFDSCELYTNAGPLQSEGATITAPSNTADSDGYLFYNCTVTGTSTATSGTFGRPWSGVNAAASYINTSIGSVSGTLLISAAGWTSMGGVNPEEARFTEYNSVDSSGNVVSTSSRKGSVLNEWSMLRYNPLIFTSGSDGWDPAGLTSTYAGVNEVIAATVIDTSDSTVDTIALPDAPSGYEFKWESDSEFAEVSDDGSELTLIRPAYGEDAIKASVKLYVRESANTGIGAEKSISFDIVPTSDTENVFTLSGTVTLSAASDEDQIITIEVMSGEAVIKTQTVTIPAGETSAAYTAEYIPVGTYTVYASTANSDYNIATASAEITGAKGDALTFDVTARKMAEISVVSVDFSDLTAAINSASGFTAEIYTVTGDETANIGDTGDVVYKLTKEESYKVAAKTGVSFDLTSFMPSGTSFDNTKTIQFSFDFLMETIDYLPSSYSYFDLATSTSNAGADKADASRFVRWGVYYGWIQLNMFTAANTRVNGDKTQFDKNNTMANKWYHIVADIDLEAQTITTTIYDRDWQTGDSGTYMLNSKPFTIASPSDDGTNSEYPTSIDLSNLYFNIYMDKSASTTNKMEYYFDNISLTYQDFE